MNRSIYLSIIGLFIIAFTIASNAKAPVSNATVTLRCSSGKTYTATTDSKGKFSFTDLDCDGDYSLSVSSEVMSWSWGASNSGAFTGSSSASAGKSSGGGAGKVSVQDLSVTKRDAASGLPTGKRQHKPFKTTHSLCSKVGKEECDDRCVISLSSDGTTITGMAINEKGLPGTKTNAPKSNK
jgi:hypothetical protein